MAAKTREEKNQERKAHLAVAPTPETAQVLTGAPAVTVIGVDPAFGGDKSVAVAVEVKNGEIVSVTPIDPVDLMGDSPPTSDTESASGWNPPAEVQAELERMAKQLPDEAFLAFIRSAKGLDLADARVRDTFDLEHRLKTAYFAGWEAARA